VAISHRDVEPVPDIDVGDGEDQGCEFLLIKIRLFPLDPAISDQLCSEYGIPYSILSPGMIPLDPLPNLIDQVYARILEAIIDRTLPPGQRIRQNELAEKLGVSRQPVSHALHLLHRQGLVAESGRRGFEVTQLDPQRIRELYEVRGAIDALAARLAAARAKTDAPGRAQLEAALQAGRAINKDTPLARLIALDVDFHGTIYRLSGNPAIEEMIAPQWPHMRRSMATVLAELDYRESAWAEHEAIAAHIFAGNAKAAEAAALAHAQTAGRLTEERLRATDKAA
jgi:DNA-binding GntR family transcriptional regulator